MKERQLEEIGVHFFIALNPDTTGSEKLTCEVRVKEAFVTTKLERMKFVCNSV